MKSSLALSLLAGTLALSLGLKLLASAPTPPSDPEAVALPVQHLLAGAGFETRVLRLGRSPGVLVAARRGECRLAAGDYPPHGTFDDVYRGLAAPFGRLAFVHRGSVTEQVPKLRGLFDYFWWRELRRIGADVRRAPILAVAASNSCRLGEIPWSKVSTIIG